MMARRSEEAEMARESRKRVRGKDASAGRTAFEGNVPNEIAQIFGGARESWRETFVLTLIFVSRRLHKNSARFSEKTKLLCPRWADLSIQMDRSRLKYPAAPGKKNDLV